MKIAPFYSLSIILFISFVLVPLLCLSRIHFELEDVDWSKIYVLPRPRATTIDSSLRSFQYKILNSTLYLNQRLFELNAVESPQCSLCKQFHEFVLYLFCTCSVTRSLWVQFCLWHRMATFYLLPT